MNDASAPLSDLPILTDLPDGEGPFGGPFGSVKADMPGAYVLLPDSSQPSIVIVHEVEGALVVGFESGNVPASGFLFLGRLPLEVFFQSLQSRAEVGLMKGLARKAGEVFSVIVDRERARGYRQDGLGKVAGVLALSVELGLLDEKERDRRFGLFINEADEYSLQVAEV